MSILFDFMQQFSVKNQKSTEVKILAGLERGRELRWVELA
jgi:hypothetical protein